MDSFQQDLEISPEEREQVLRQIETVISEGRTPGSPEGAVVQAEKRGLLFPLLINLAALVLIALGVFLLVRYFELRKENITLRRHRSTWLQWRLGWLTAWVLIAR